MRLVRGGERTEDGGAGPQHCPVTGLSRAGFQTRPGRVPLGSSLQFRAPFTWVWGPLQAGSLLSSVRTGPRALDPSHFTGKLNVDEEPAVLGPRVWRVRKRAHFIRDVTGATVS